MVHEKHLLPAHPEPGDVAVSFREPQEKRQRVPPEAYQVQRTVLGPWNWIGRRRSGLRQHVLHLPLIERFSLPSNTRAQPNSHRALDSRMQKAEDWGTHAVTNAEGPTRVRPSFKNRKSVLDRPLRPGDVFPPRCDGLSTSRQGAGRPRFRDR